MATQPDDLHDEPDNAEDTAPEAEREYDEAAQAAAGEGDELIVEIEGDEGGDDSHAIRGMRERLRQQSRRIKELESGGGSQPKGDRGPRPTLEAFDYDEDKHTAALEEWINRGRDEADEQRRTEDVTRTQRETAERERNRAVTDAARKGLKDFDAAEKVVADTLGADYVGFIYRYANKPAELVAALAKNPSFLAGIEGEEDPVRRMLRLRDAEGKLKVSNRRAPPPPEGPTNVRGSAPIAPQSGDKKLDDLRKQAEKTGDYTKLAEHKANLRKMGKAA